MKTKFAALLLSTVALAGCDSLTPVETIECGTVAQDECLNAWFDEKFEEQLAFSPILQTGLGRKTDYDKIDDFSEDAQLAQLEWMRDATAQMEAATPLAVGPQNYAALHSHQAAVNMDGARQLPGGRVGDQAAQDRHNATVHVKRSAPPTRV